MNKLEDVVQSSLCHSESLDSKDEEEDHGTSQYDHSQFKSQQQRLFDDKDELTRARKPPIVPLRVDLTSQIKTSIYGGSSESVTNIDSQFSFLDQSKLFKMKKIVD